MAYKRIVRIAGFVALNLFIISSPFIYAYVKFTYFDDDCDGCYSLQKSESKGEARKNKTLINTYRIIKTDLENSLLKKAIEDNKIEFWKEHVKIIPRHSGESFEDTLLVWSREETTENMELKFKLLDKNKFIEPKESFGFWDLGNEYRDTIIIGVFQKEEINQGNFIYIKTKSNL